MTQDGPFRPTPQIDALGPEPVDLISNGGHRVLSIIEEAQARLKLFVRIPDYMLDPHDLDVYRHNLVHMHISGYLFSPKLEFGNLGNPQKPCEITLFAARQMYPTVGQHPATADGVRLEYGEELLFGKKLAIELLSKVSPGETVRVRGRGRYRVYSEIRSQYDELADNPNVNYDDRTRVRLTLELSLSEDSRKVVFSITTRKTGTEKLTFEKGRLLRAPRYSYR